MKQNSDKKKEVADKMKGFDSQKRWGNSAQKGVGANSPAMMEARKAAQTLKPQGRNFGEHNDSSKNIERNRA